MHTTLRQKLLSSGCMLPVILAGLQEFMETTLPTLRPYPPAPCWMKLYKNQKEIRISTSLLVMIRIIRYMQEKGFEPSQHCYHTDLNRARLPIPPFLQVRLK